MDRSGSRHLILCKRCRLPHRPQGNVPLFSERAPLYLQGQKMSRRPSLTAQGMLRRQVWRVYISLSMSWQSEDTTSIPPLSLRIGVKRAPRSRPNNFWPGFQVHSSACWKTAHPSFWLFSLGIPFTIPSCTQDPYSTSETECDLSRARVRNLEP